MLDELKEFLRADDMDYLLTDKESSTYENGKSNCYINKVI